MFFDNFYLFALFTANTIFKWRYHNLLKFIRKFVFTFLCFNLIYNNIYDFQRDAMICPIVFTSGSGTISPVRGVTTS